MTARTVDRRRHPVPARRAARRQHRARRAARARGRRARRADRAAAGAVRGALLLPRGEGRVVRRRPRRSTRTRRVARMREVARELGVVIPVSFFERAGQAYYNSVAIVDADGAVLGVYRKSHIPDGPGYEEKFYFRPGDTGFRVWETQHGTRRRRHLLGPVVPRVGARHDAAGRRGAPLPDGHRQRAARAGPRHARPLAARDDRPRGVQRRPRRRRQPHRRPRAGQLFYGSSFIADHRGDKVAELGRDDEGVVVAQLRPRRAGAHAGLVGLLPRPPAGPLRRACTTARWASRRKRARRRAARGRRFAANASCAPGHDRKVMPRLHRRGRSASVGDRGRHAASQGRLAHAALGLRAVPRRRVRAVRRAAPHPVAAAAVASTSGSARASSATTTTTRPTFKSRKLNAFYSAWLSVFYGFPTFAWIPTHNLNHHKYVNKAGDATITWRYSKKNTWLIASTYYFVSAYWQAPSSRSTSRRRRPRTATLYRQIIGQYATLAGVQVGPPRARHRRHVGLRHDAWWRGRRDLVLRLRRVGHVRELVDDLHQLHPARARRPVVGAQPLAQLRRRSSATGCVFNNGFHTAHHESAGLHWSKLPEAHAKIAHLIDPDAEPGEHHRRTACGRTCSGIFSDRYRTHQVGRAAYDPPDGGEREAGDGVGRGGRSGRQRVDGVVI